MTLDTPYRRHWCATSIAVFKFSHGVSPGTVQSAAELAAMEIALADGRRVRLDQELFASAQTSTESATSADRYVSLMLEELGVDDGEVARAMSTWRRTYNPPVGVWGCPDPDAGAAASE